MYRGDSYPLEFTITNTDGQEVDLTESTLKFTVNSVKDPVDDSTQLFQIDGDLNVDPTTGKVVFFPTEVQTDLPKGKYYYDIELRSISGQVRTVAKESFTILQDISK